MVPIQQKCSKISIFQDKRSYKSSYESLEISGFYGDKLSLIEIEKN